MTNDAFDVNPKKQILSQLQKLMSKHKPWDEDGAGVPYVSSEDGVFGVTCGRKNGGLYAAYFLMDKLAAGGLFDGPANKGTDLDTAMYTLGGNGPFKVYNGATLLLNDEGILEVRIETTKSKGEILDAIDGGIEKADREIAMEQQRKRAYEEKKAADRAKESHPPILSPAQDLAFVTDYIKKTILEAFPDAWGISTHTEPASQMMIEMFDDRRPSIVVTYDHQRGAEGFSRDNDFMNGRLTEVFTGLSAVHINQSKRTGLEFAIAGNPSRLMGDIMDYESRKQNGQLRK